MLTMHAKHMIMFTTETDDAEITADMISKRVRAGESRAEAQSVKWTVEGAVKGKPSILRRGGLR